MAYKIQITESAKIELEEIVKYIAETLANPKAAGDLLTDFEEKKSFLCDSPFMYPLCTLSRLQKKGYRRFLFKKNYVALYLVDEENMIVTIMHIFYARRDYEKLV